MTDVKRWLTEDEYDLYVWETEGNPHPASRDRLRANVFESLAAEREISETRRALLKKHEWHEANNGAQCLECEAWYDGTEDFSYYYDDNWALKDFPHKKPPNYGKMIIMGKGRLHKPDCKWDTALQGVGE